MVLHWGGIISIVVFYVLILAVGIWAGRKSKGATEEEVMLAGRNIGLFVGMFTMTATWVGGGYINGTAEIVYSRGVVWCQGPFGYALSLILGGFLFAKKMRAEGYVTMLDPLQKKFGERMGGLLFLPALFGEVCWSAAILAALGSTLSVILEINNTLSIIISACIAIFYTLFGGLYAVAYTDVAQLGCIFVGLWLAVPFALKHQHVAPIGTTMTKWIGSIKYKCTWKYIDDMLMLIFGGIPWQVYFQRVLSSESATKAMYLSYAAAFGCFIMAIPSVLIGAAARSADWNSTGYTGVVPIPEENEKLILPLVLQYLTPDFVSWIGLGAISAAVMSSADSSVLSASSMYARNVWKLVIHQKAGDREIVWVMRIGIFIVGIAATIMAVMVESIYSLWTLCADLVYVILFPQLLLVVHWQKANTYGSLASYVLGLTFRLLVGEPVVRLPASIRFPGYDVLKMTQAWPYKSMSMIFSLSILISVSLLTDYLFINRKINSKYDIFHCLVNIPVESIPLRSPTLYSTQNINAIAPNMDLRDDVQKVLEEAHDTFVSSPEKTTSITKIERRKSKDLKKKIQSNIPILTEEEIRNASLKRRVKKSSVGDSSGSDDEAMKRIKINLSSITSTPVKEVIEEDEKEKEVISSRL
ncbi:hypothetical protein SNEBB_005192 [Seison nebaliae]|nr:hypothetical protein SNEBB_005192 [Seison nebaliae]